MRAWTWYEQIELDQPGTPCRIHTSAHRNDLKEMVEDIRKAKLQADLVILSMHWGIHFVPAVIAEYQREVARIAIDSGANLIIGHHTHILKGIEVYRGKVILYNLGNFALDLPFTFAEGLIDSPGHKEIQTLFSSQKLDPEYSLPADTRKTLIAKCVITDKEIRSVAVLPAYINGQSQPEVLSSQDERFDEVVRYLEEITRDQGLNTRYTVAGDEVVISK